MKYFYISILWVLLFTFHCIQFKEHPLDPTTLQGQLLQNILKYSTKANDNNNNPTFILMFPAYEVFDGNIKGAVAGANTTREAVDTICSDTFLTFANDFPEYSNIIHIRGFISIDITDKIIDMPIKFGVPTNVPIVGPDTNNPNRLVADNWNDLWNDDGGGNYIKNSLETAIGLIGYWWSGSSMVGDVSPSTCLGWTNNSNYEGELGDNQTLYPIWISTNISSCGYQRYILCIAW